MYFTGRTDRIPRVAAKAAMALSKSDSQTEKTWILEQCDIDPFGFHQQDNSPQHDFIAAYPGGKNPRMLLAGAFMLDPLFLDRPPPAC
jgi:hypothetical protein